VANTRDQRSTGRDPFEPPTFTPGPWGKNDPGEPFSDSTGDTPGPAGAGGDRAQQLALEPEMCFTQDRSKYSLQIPKLNFPGLNPELGASTTTAQPQPASDPANLLTLIAAQNEVMKDAKLMPAEIEVTDDKGNKTKSTTTHCSEATFAVAKKTGVAWDGILGTERDGNFVANKMIDGLEKAVKDGTYKVVEPDEARTLANQGVTVFATQAKPGGHGHIATVRPEGVKGDTPDSPFTKPLLANVGASNGVKGYLAEPGRTYGVFVTGSKGKPVIFYAPAK
jgi:hypothetical protein